MSIYASPNDGDAEALASRLTKAGHVAYVVDDLVEFEPSEDRPDRVYWFSVLGSHFDAVFYEV